MKSPHGFIVRPVTGKRYANTVDMEGTQVMVSTSEEDHKFSNRFAEVIETPVGYTGDITQGAILLVHHNVFKFYNDVYGNRKSGKSFLYDDLFMVENDQFFLYNNSNGWVCNANYCFLKPIPAINNLSIEKLITREPLIGEVKYSNPWLRSKNVAEGSVVCFKPDSEYEFVVDGETLYRLYDHQIVIKLS